MTRTGEWFVPLHPSTLAGLRVSSGEQDSTQSERIQRSYERLKMRVGSRRSTPKQVCGGTPWEVDFSHGMANRLSLSIPLANSRKSIVYFHQC